MKPIYGYDILLDVINSNFTSKTYKIFKKNKLIVSGWRWFNKNIVNNINRFICYIIFNRDVYKIICSPFPDKFKQKYLLINKNRNQNLFYTKKIKIFDKKNKNGSDFIMCLDLSDEAEIDYINSYGTELITLMKNVLNKGDIFVDIGAHIGYFSLTGAFLGARVISFEPEQLNYCKLHFNVRINNFLKKIDAFNLALSDTTGKIELTVNPINKGGHNVNKLPPNLFYDYYTNKGYKIEKDKKQMVEVDRLDNIIKKMDIKRKIKLIKIDVEGHEEHVLKGMVNLLRINPPVYICIEDKFIEWKIYYDFLKKYNYKILFFKGTELTDIENKRTNYNDVLFVGEVYSSQNVQPRIKNY